MPRTNRSIYREAEFTSRISRLQRRLNLSRFSVGSSILVTAAAVTDTLSNASLTKFYNAYVLDALPGIDFHIPTSDVATSRLAVAGLYTAVGIISALNSNRIQNRINHSESMASQEEQMDRLATVLRLSVNQRDPVNVIPEPGDII